MYFTYCMVNLMSSSFPKCGHSSTLPELRIILQKFFKNEGTLYLACNDRKAFFTSTDHRGYTHWSCQNVCDALSYILDNIYIRFGNKLYRQTVGIPMGTNYAPVEADLFYFVKKEIS